MCALRTLGLGLFLGLALAASVSADEARDEGWRNDIDTLEQTLPAVHPDLFHTRPRELFESDLALLREQVPTLSDLEIAVRLQQAVAALRDEHTQVYWTIRLVSFYPIRVEWFSDGLWVTKTTEASESACGTRVVAINGMEIDEVFRRVATVISHGTIQWAEFRSPMLLVSPELLEILGVVDANAPTRFLLENERGLRFGLDLSPISRIVAQRTIFAEDLETEATPLYRRSPSLFYWAELIPDEHVMYIKYNQCANGPGETFEEFAARVLGEMDAEQVERVIVDMRDNTGGSDAIIRPLGLGIVERGLDLPDRFFVVIGRGTFSSAVINAWQVDTMSNGTLVGIPTGGSANHFGNVSSFVLPYSATTVFHSTDYFELEPGNDGGIEPDVDIPVSSDDFFTNRDPVLDWILSQGITTSASSARRRGARRPAMRVCPQ